MARVWYIEGMKSAPMVAGILMAALAIGGCASVTFNVGNPAASNCRKQGGTLRTEVDQGKDRNICVLSDGSSFEEWVERPKDRPAK